MKLSTRGRYGIHAMYDLAVHYGDGPQSIKLIAERQAIPEAYLEQLIALLRRDNLPCKVMVGGAVLTEDYARHMGADFYARDAKQGVDVARQVFQS